MRKLLAISLMLTILLAVRAVGERRIALLFAAKAGEGATASHAAETTLAIKTYLRQTGKAEVADFDPESALIRRAVLEHRVKSEDLVGVTTPDSRIRMAGLIGTDLAVTGDVSIKNNAVTVSVWMADVRTKKVWRSDANAGISTVGDPERAASNALQAAASTVIYQLADESLKGVKPGPSPPTTEGPTTAVEPADSEPAGTADGAAAHLDKADAYAKAGDEANAILEYRKAVNADAKNMDARLKLVKLYAKRKMYTQAVDELERAQQIDPDSPAVRDELARIYEERGAPDRAADVYTGYANRHPKDLVPRLVAGDHYWRQNKLKDAEKQYRLAAEADPANYAPHERLALLLAAQSLFEQGRPELELLQKLDPKPDQKTLADRYTRFYSLIDRDLKALLVQYDSGAASFADRSITREYYYGQLQGVTAKLDAISRFLSLLTPPESASSSHRHRALGCSLFLQACDHTLRYLETNKAADKDNAAIFIGEARKHLGESPS